MMWKDTLEALDESVPTRKMNVHEHCMYNIMRAAVETCYLTTDA